MGPAGMVRLAMVSCSGAWRRVAGVAARGWVRNVQARFGRRDVVRGDVDRCGQARWCEVRFVQARQDWHGGSSLEMVRQVAQV
jgi:hypothetical protein